MSNRYSSVQIALHWLTALLIVLIVALPYGLDFFEPLLGGTGQVFTLHKSLGLSVLALTLLRITVRTSFGAPQLLPAYAAWKRSAARIWQGLIYALLLLIPLSGLLFGRKPVDLFWLIEVGPVPLAGPWRDLARLFHLSAQYLLFALIFGHACMALWHHYWLRDGVLKAMLPRHD